MHGGPATATNECLPCFAPFCTIQPLHRLLTLQINYGEHLRVVGSSEALGGWEVDKAPQMVWNEGHIWTATVDMPVGEQFEFKFVHIMPVR